MLRVYYTILVFALGSEPKPFLHANSAHMGGSSTTWWPRPRISELTGNMVEWRPSGVGGKANFIFEAL
jgi:hypothetical protein